MSEPNTIDLTPSWEDVADILILVLEQGADNDKLAAREEVRRMAKSADRALALAKECNSLLARVKEQEDRIERLEAHVRKPMAPETNPGEADGKAQD